MIFFAKSSQFMLYYRLFRINKFARYAIIFGMIFSLLNSFSNMTAAAILCSPKKRKSTGFYDCTKTSPISALNFHNHKFESGYIPVHFTDPNNLEIAAVVQEEDWDPCSFYGWVILSSILSRHKGSLTFFIALSSRAS